LLAGGDGLEQQTVVGELTADNIHLFSVDDGGIARAALGRLVQIDRDKRWLCRLSHWPNTLEQSTPLTWERALAVIGEAAAAARAEAAEEAIAQEAREAELRANAAHNAGVLAAFERKFIADPAARVPKYSMWTTAAGLKDNLLWPCHPAPSLSVECQVEATRRDKADEAARVAAEGQKKEEQAALLREFVAQHGSPSQVERLGRGLLPSLELKELVGGYLFAALSDFPRYQRMTATDVHGEYEEAEGHVKFSALEAKEIPEKVWAVYKAIEAAAGDVVSVEPWLHVGSCECEGVPIQERYGVKVVKALGSRNIAREFAA